MRDGPSMLKRAYHAVALFSVLNLAGMIGLALSLAFGGTLDGEKLRRIAAVLRDLPSPTEGSAPSSGQVLAAVSPAAARPGGTGAAPESQTDLEIIYREGERTKAELEQRLALSNSILLRVTAERESFRREREDAAREQELAGRARREEGFKKQVEIYESLAPKVAVEHLLAVPEPDEAAKILLQIETRKAKAIIEAAKRGDQMEKMRVILQRMREVAPERSTDLESQEQ